jgi:signal transduction histidine kinase
MVPHVNNNKVVGFYALISDISDRKKIEEALARALKEFEEKNEELTIINTDLDNFVYTASHDLRAPISNLEGLHQLLIRRVSEKLNESEKEIMDLMHKSIFRLKNTIGELSEIAKVQKEFLPQEVLYFEEIIREVKDDIEPLISEASAEIREVLEVKSIAYPKKHLRSILYNLISNAIKYRSTERSTIIEIKTTEFNGKTRLSVSDNGLGLEERQLGKLFKMFKRFHTHVEGSGIGLYMIKRMIENNGGSITVVSKPGEGTTFHVDF